MDIADERVGFFEHFIFKYANAAGCVRPGAGYSLGKNLDVDFWCGVLSILQDDPIIAVRVSVCLGK